MSERDVSLFLEKVNRDEPLRSRLAELPGDDIAGIVSLAETEGFSFSEQEWRDARARDPLELDEELENVAGGLSPQRTMGAVEKIDIAVEKVER